VTTLLARILEHATERGDRVFARVWDGNHAVETLTYRDFVLRASGIARKLHRAGVAEGDVVVIIIRSQCALVYCWLAPLLLGAVPCLLPWPTGKLSREYYERTVAMLLETSQATALLTATDLMDTLQPLTTTSPRLRAIVTAEPLEIPEMPYPPPRGVLVDPERMCVLQHSSGSTGLQKGVALSSRAIVNQLRAHGASLGLSSADRYANWMPLYHDGGLIGGFLQPLFQGLPLSIVSPMDWVKTPAVLLHMISTDRSTLCWLPNFAYKFMSRISEVNLRGIDLSCMRAFINSGEPVRVASHQAFLERFGPYGLDPLALTTSYGTAENTLAISQTDPTRPVRIDIVDRLVLARDGRAVGPGNGAPSQAVVSGGTLLRNTRLRVLGNAFEDLPDRQVGEFAVQSDCMLTEYYHRPDLSRQAFHDGWYLTGDYGYTAEGEIFPCGRKKDLIIVAGNNIYPQDLEFIADHAPGVHPGRTVAFGVENETLGTEDVVVIVETEPGVQPGEVEQAVAERIARESDCSASIVYVVPPMWLIKTSSGKISRTRCKEKFLRETSSDG